MKRYLLDTNVVSMLAPTKGEVSADFLTWLDRTDNEGRVFLSVVTLHEIARGVALLENKGALAKARALNGWLSGLVTAYGDKILGLNASDALRAGRVEAIALSAGYKPGMADAIIAGIAEANDLIVVTQNKKHFHPFGVPVETPEAVCSPQDPTAVK